MQRSVFSPLKGRGVLLSSIRGLQQKCNKIIDCDSDLLPLQVSLGGIREGHACSGAARATLCSRKFILNYYNFRKRGILQFALKELNQGVCLSKKCRQKGNLPCKITPLRDQLAAFLFVFVFVCFFFLKTFSFIRITKQKETVKERK